MPVKCHVNQHALPLSHNKGDTGHCCCQSLCWGYRNVPALLLHHRVCLPPPSQLFAYAKATQITEKWLLSAHQRPHMGHGAPEAVSSSNREILWCSVTSGRAIKGMQPPDGQGACGKPPQQLPTRWSADQQGDSVFRRLQENKNTAHLNRAGSRRQLMGKGKREQEEKSDTSQIWRVILWTPDVLPVSSARTGQCQRYSQNVPADTLSTLSKVTHPAPLRTCSDSFQTQTVAAEAHS